MSARTLGRCGRFVVDLDAEQLGKEDGEEDMVCTGVQQAGNFDESAWTNDANGDFRSGDFPRRNRWGRVHSVSNVGKDHRILAPIMRTFGGGDLPRIGFGSPALIAASLTSLGVDPLATIRVISWSQAIHLPPYSI